MSDKTIGDKDQAAQPSRARIPVLQDIVDATAEYGRWLREQDAREAAGKRDEHEQYNYE